MNLDASLWAGLGLFFSAVIIGAFGTLVGAGGGFILVPALLFLYPGEEPEVITSISLAVILANALSGSIAYWLKRRIDLGSAVAFLAAAIPFTILGVIVNHHLPRRVFDPLFGVTLILIALWVWFASPGKSGRPTGLRGNAVRKFTDSVNEHYEYSYSMPLGVFISCLVGFLSSLLGIGGGIIHVPAMVHLLNFPVHVATATSHLVLGGTALAATATHAVSGSLRQGGDRLIWLIPGVLIGAPLGARLSKYVHGQWILRALSVAMALVGTRLLMR